MSSILSFPGDKSSERLGRLYGRVYRRWRRYVDDAFRDQGFTEATRAPLVLLPDLGQPVRQKDLAEELGLEPSALVRVVDVLAGRGLVTSAVDPADRRSKLVSLTEAGQETAARIVARVIEIEKSLFRDVSEAELAALRSALGKVLSRFSTG